MLSVVNPTPVSWLNDRFGVWNRSLAGAPDRFAAYKPGYVAPSDSIDTGSNADLPMTQTSGGFNLNPKPTSGRGPFGAVPGQLGLPNPAADLAGQVPGLSSLNSAASSGILGKLKGELSPGTLNALKNASAQFGVSSGMPGSGLSSNAFLGNVAGASEAQQAAGIQEYNSFIPTVSGTQTVTPALQNEIATQNSLNAAAPDPTQAASYAQQLFNQYLSRMGGGNPGGGMSNFGGGGGIAGQVNAAVNPVLSRYEADLDRKIMAARNTPSGYYQQQAPGAGTVNAPYAPMNFGMIAPSFNYQTSPWNDLYGTKQDFDSFAGWE